MAKWHMTEIGKNHLEFSTVVQNQGGRFSIPAVICRAAKAGCGSSVDLEVRSRKGSWRGTETLRSGEEIVARMTSPLTAITPAGGRVRVRVRW